MHSKSARFFYFLIVLVLLVFVGILSFKTLNSRDRKPDFSIKFISPYGEKVALGEVNLVTRKTYSAYSVSGLVGDFYRKDGRSYLGLGVPAGVDKRIILIDFGPDNYKVSLEVGFSESSRSSESANFLTSSRGNVISHAYNRTTKELYSIFNTLKSRPVRINLLVSADFGDRECVGVCALYKDELEKYGDNNKRFGDSNGGFAKGEVVLGAPFSVEISQ